jgi:hypothetical protein
MMIPSRRSAILLGGCLAGPLFAQAPAPPASPVLDRLVGHWAMEGTVRGKQVRYRLEAAWTLQHRFVELHMLDTEHTPPQYEARVFVGPDTLPNHVVAHWLDNTGAAYSVPPATGQIQADSLTLDFPYPEGAFHDSFVLDRVRDSWTIRLDARDKAGGWKRFAEYRAVRLKQ